MMPSCCQSPIGNCPLRMRRLGARELLVLQLALYSLFFGNPPGVLAAENSGRIRLNYSESSRLGMETSQIFQEYNVSSQDDIFGANRLRLDFRWERLVDYEIDNSVDRPTLRAMLTGLTYEFTMRYAPLQYTSPAGRSSGSKVEGLQAAWQYWHDGLPRVRLEYREDKRHQAVINFNTFSSVSRMRLAELDHSIGGLRFGGSYRHTINTSTSSSAGDRDAGTATLRASFDQKISPSLRFSVGGDVQRSEVDQGSSPTSVGRTRNLRGNAVWSILDKLQVGVSGFYRESLSEGGGRPSLFDANRTLAARAVFRPIPELDLTVQRDIRDINRPDNNSFFDVLRLQAVYSGMLRRGLRARLTGMKNVTIKTENSRTPADATDITLHFNIFRRVIARASLTYNRQQHRDSGFLSQHAVNKIFEIKSQLSRLFFIRLDYRGSQTSRAFEFFEIDSHNYSANLNYTNPAGFSLSGSARRSLLFEGDRRSQTFFGLNIAGRLTENLSFTLDGTWSEQSAIVLGGSAASYNARMNYRFSRSAFVTAGWQTSGRNGGQGDESFSASFQATF